MPDPYHFPYPFARLFFPHCHAVQTTAQERGILQKIVTFLEDAAFLCCDRILPNPVTGDAPAWNRAPSSCRGAAQTCA